MDSRQLSENLKNFSNWAKQYCIRSERSDAQPFLNEFFKAFGYAGAFEAGAKFEDPQQKASKKGKTGFLDCIFPEIVVIEMKKRGTDLVHHYNQLKNYWWQCTPKPKYAVLCNFDEFWIYDFNVQVDTPVQAIRTDELHEHPEALLFMLGKNKIPKFNRNLVEITEKAAGTVSQVYTSLIERKKSAGLTDLDAQRFILQCVLCMFAEDIDLLPRFFFAELLEECKKNPTHSYDLIEGLFSQMNNPKPARGGRYKEVKYFNGGLFSSIAPIELLPWEIDTLLTACDQNWKAVRPSIFGTILEKTMDEKERHAGGVHYTSEIDIHKIVEPTIVRYWDQRIEEAGTTQKDLRKLLNEIRQYKVLDPACGSGNFLYIAYQELKRIEKEIVDKLAEISARDNEDQARITYVSPMQFYGIDIKPFATELAKLTLEIGRKIAIDKLGLAYENPLPLENLDKNIICADALFTDWVEANAIIGNPPFLGEKRMRTELGNEYVEKVRKHFGGVPQNIDFCTYWFRKAHEQKEAKRIGLVGTNSISQGQSREAGLAYIVADGGVIHDAISTQQWSGEAVVHVSIVNWAKSEQKQKFLDKQSVSFINSSLKSEVDITKAYRLKQNKNVCFQGVKPVGEKFLVSEKLAQDWINKDFKNKNILKIFSMGKNLANSPDFLSNRWIIDFNEMSLEEASVYREVFEYSKLNLKSEREKHKVLKLRDYWWRFEAPRPNMRKALQDLEYCFAVPRVSKWNVFIIFPHKTMLPGDKSLVVASEDFYLLGILNSNLHRNWVESQASTLKGDTAYTNTTCFETFPFLWNADEKLKKPVREIMKELDDFRMAMMKERNYGITKLYNEFFPEPASKLFKLHCHLDEAVCKVYGWKYDSNKNYNEQLFKLNQKLYEEELAEPKAMKKALKPL